MDKLNIDELVEQYRNDQAILEEIQKNQKQKLCVILAYQMDGERYKYVEGYHSLPEYAEKVLHIKRELCYMYAKVGKRFLLSQNERIREIAEQIPVSNLSEIANLSDPEIILLFEDGYISGDSTQDQLRDIYKTFTEAKEEKDTLSL